MRIETATRSANLSRAGAAARGGGATFTPVGGEAPARVAQAAPVAAMAGLDAILALQTVDGPLEGKRRAVRKGRSVLDLLEGIKADLLVGLVSPDRLDQLAASLSGIRGQSIPGLDTVLEDIDLRVRVELAKLGRFPDF